MQERSTLARPYAEAAFDQAREEGELGRWSEMLGLVGAIVADRQMRALLNNPRVEPARLLQLIGEICGDRLSTTGRNFLHILVRSRRIGLAPEIARLFEEKRAAAEGIARVHVLAAYELQDAQRERIAGIMQRRLGKKVEITSSTDQSLIGGAIIRSGDSVIDASIRGLLDKLRIEFAH